jgi:uncharacterized membrane protein
MAHEDAGINLTGTHFGWMESWIWIAVLVVAFVTFWVLDRRGTSPLVRMGGSDPETAPAYLLFCAVLGALLFAASLADGGQTTWPGLIAGAIAGFVGYLAFARFFNRANRRLAAAGDPGVVLGLGRDLLTIVVAVVVVLTNWLGYAVLLAAIVLLVTARRREGEKYEGLRILR